MGVAAEAAWRTPVTPPPLNVFADSVWERDLPKQLKGKTFAITGASRGMGYELATRIAERGGNLILLNRTGAHAEEARAEIEKIAKNAGGSSVLVNCDLCDFKTVRTAAAEVHKVVAEKKWGLDSLVLNAGLMAQKDVRTIDGYDIQMQANHLSHFLLTALLLDELEKTAKVTGEARVVSHSSGARKYPPGGPLIEDCFEKSWPETDGKKSEYEGDKSALAKWKRYQQSKRANLAFTYALADLFESRGSGVKALCAHPGASNSGLQSRTGGGAWVDNFINGLAARAGHSTGDGALGISVASCKEGVKNGEFFGPDNLTGTAVLLPSEKEEYSKENLRLLWDKSIEATGAKW